MKPPAWDEGQVDPLVRAALLTVAFARSAGREYVERLVDAGGDEAVARAFQSPPEGSQPLLDPRSGKRGSPRYDRAIEHFMGQHHVVDWLYQSQALEHGQIDAAFGPLPEPERARLTAGLLSNSFMRTYPGDDPSSKQITYWLFECKSPLAAAQLLASEGALLFKKDRELIRVQADVTEPRVLARARYVAFSRPESSVYGLYSWKRIKVHSSTVDVSTLVLVRGRYGVELTYSRENGPQSELEAEGLALLDQAFR